MEPLVEVLVVGPDRAVAARGEALAAEGDEAARHHGARLGVVGRLQHRGPEDRVMLNDVAADHVDDPPPPGCASLAPSFHAASQSKASAPTRSVYCFVEEIYSIGASTQTYKTRSCGFSPG